MSKEVTNPNNPQLPYILKRLKILTQELNKTIHEIPNNQYRESEKGTQELHFN